MSLRVEDIISGIGQKGPSSDASSHIAALKNAWVSERMAPVLLPYAEASVDSVMQNVRELAEVVEERSLTLQDSASQDSNAKLHLLILETEMERAKFIARSYLRARIAKIDKNLIFYATNKDSQPISVAEGLYIDRHVQSLYNLYSSSFLQSWPEGLRMLDDTGGPVTMVDAPNIDKPVAIRVIRDHTEPLVVANETLTLDQGSILLLRYAAVADLLQQSEPPVELV